MTVQKEILRLKKKGISQRKAARLLKKDRATIKRYWDGLREEDESSKPEWTSTLDLKSFEKELQKVPKKTLYQELCESIEMPSYQAFCKYLRNNTAPKEPKITVKIDRVPGDSIEVDWSGDSVNIINPATGELYKVELFVGSMSYSGKIFAEFKMGQKLEDFIDAHNSMFFFFGGVPRYIIPDNCKTAVTKADKYDPKINRTYQDMSEHYNIVVDPADSYSPQHKPNVENAVKYIQTSFLPSIRNKTYTTIIDLNRDLRTWLDKINKKVIQGRVKSRDDFFEEEKDFLKELPKSTYQLFSLKRAKVHPDCHFQHQRSFYSVPYRFVGKEITVKFNSKSVHAYYNCELIASHTAHKGHGKHATNSDHYPEKKLIEANYHLAAVRNEARSIGENTLAIIERVLKESRFPLKNLRRVQGIVRLANKYGKEQLEYGCELAIEYEKYGYYNIKKFTESHKYKNRTKTTEAPTRDVEFICLQGGLSNGNN